MKTKLSLLYLLFSLYSLVSLAQYDSISFDGLERTYLLHLPSDYNGEELPLIIAMHGGFGSGPQLETQSELSIKADEENFIVVYPEGVKSPLNIRTWNAGTCCGYTATNDIDDVGFINALIDSLAENYAIDSLRIYATGMSNGGMMSYRLACELSHRIAAIAPVATTMVAETCNPDHPVPIIHFHSYLDSNVPYEGGIGDGVSDHYNPPLDSVFTVWATINDCMNVSDTITNDIDLTHVIWDNCECNYSIEYYITQDGGHSWPGGIETLLGDPSSQLISANDLLWTFFNQYSLECDEALFLQETPVEEQKVKIYPNPTTGTLILAGKNIRHVIVYNSSGQVFLDLEIQVSDLLNLDLSSKPKGNYFIRVEMDEGHEEMIRVSLQ